MDAKHMKQSGEKVDRRNFLRSAAKAGAGLTFASLLERHVLAATAPPRVGSSDDLNVAIIGSGEQGRVLLESCLRIPGLRFRALCDIWSYSQIYGSRLLKKYGHVVNIYEDYREMLAQEKDLDAVLIATPDWVHAEHTIACLEAGLDVYCEKEMSNSLDEARRMVEAARTTKHLLQIGHQRRSNPRYIHAIDKIIRGEELLGRVTHASAQWNRSKSDDLGWGRKYEMDETQLAKYGYNSMFEFRNWRWFKKYGGGPLVDLGSHQIDLFAWVFGVNPSSVMAGGGVNFYKHHEWYDNAICIYEYINEKGVNRATYQVLTTTKHGGFYETFMGENGTVVISEVPQRGNAVEREAHAEPWEKYVKMGLVNPMREPLSRSTSQDTMLDVRVTADAGKWPIPVELAKPAHQPHLENFFSAIRNGTPLNCPPEVGYESAVAVLRANDAVALDKKLTFSPEDFHA